MSLAPMATMNASSVGSVQMYVGWPLSKAHSSNWPVRLGK